MHAGSDGYHGICGVHERVGQRLDPLDYGIAAAAAASERQRYLKTRTMGCHAV